MTLLSRISTDWRLILEDKVSGETLASLEHKMKAEKRQIFPQEPDIFKAFELCPYAATKVVILGQDPYSDGRATGLAFAVRGSGFKKGSLGAIFRRLRAAGLEPPPGNELQGWARQGVLLLNTVLTVPEGRAREAAGGHLKWGWQAITGAAVDALKLRAKPVLFLAWGLQARDFVDADADPVNRWWCYHPAYPSKAARAFNRMDHFHRIGPWLAQAGHEQICWHKD